VTAFGQTFSDMTTATATQILPAIGAKASNGMTSDTGIVIGSVGVPGSCPSSSVNPRDDGALIQKISITPPPGGTTLKLTQLILTNLGSAPSTDLGTIPQTTIPSNSNLVIYDFNSKKCITVATVVSTSPGAPFSTSITFSSAFDLTGITTLAIAIQAAAAGNWSANMIGDTIQLRTQISYQFIQGSVTSNFSATTTSGVTFSLGLGTFNELTLIPSDLVPVNTNPQILENLQYLVNAANEGRLNPIMGQTYGLAIRDVCVLNLGSARADNDIDSITLSSTQTKPTMNVSGTGTNLTAGTKCVGAGLTAFGSFNSSGGLGVSLQTPPATIINSIIPTSLLITGFTLTIQLRSNAGLGQTLRLQTALILAPTVLAGGVQTESSSALPGGANPRALMSKTLSLESGQAHLSVRDTAVVLRSPGQSFPPTTETTLNASNFKAPGVQSFSAMLSYDPILVQIVGSGCAGIRGIQTPSQTQTQISNCQVDNGHGTASFLVQVVPNTITPTGGPTSLATITLQAGIQANASSSTLFNLAVSNVRAKNGSLISVTATPALIHYISPGDFNGDGQVGIDDAVQLANAILNAMNAGCGANAFANLGLTLSQLEAANIVSPFATPANPPIFSISDFTCANITSADVAAIARRSLPTGGASALSALQALASSSYLNALQITSLMLTPTVPRSGASVELAAHGYGIAGLGLRFYDLAGRLILNESADSSRLRFRLADGQGRPLARGAYLYVVTVRGMDGIVIQSEVRKLIVR
jgi:hypothetical protein